jgi:transcriptional regulator with AAA-type ATPase domain/tetratricopeptide (TPR) repeat protein
VASLDELIGKSPPMTKLRRAVDDILRMVSGAREIPPILIQGETGTGKTTLAGLIHRSSARARGPFVDVNCASFTESLLESEMFGYERHTFTGGGAGRGGLFQAAHRGVLLLDEIGNMSIALQAKLLKVLDDGAREVRRVGATRGEAVDVAVIAATNADLPSLVRQGHFRQDLLSRLAGMTLNVPPLRARGDDIELLAERFLRRFCEEWKRPPKTLSPDARAALRKFSWPNNVRQLVNVMRRTAFQCESDVVTANDLGLDVELGGPVAGVVAAPVTSGDDRELLVQALTRTGWNISQTARALEISRNTVKARMEKYRLQPPHARATTPSAAAGATATEPVPPAPTAVAPARRPAAVTPAPLAPTAPEMAPPTPGVRWTRRLVTLLRARVRSEVPVSLAVTTRVLEAVIERVQSFGGRVDSVGSQGLLAVFGLEPDEDAPRRAAHAGLAIVKGFDGPPGLSIAVGLHVTQMLLADVGGSVTLDEEAKAEAWRTLDGLTRAGAAGVALSDTAARFLGRRLEVAPGDDRVAAWLVGPAPKDLKFGPSEFVGRQRELSLLEGLLERVTAGHGQLVSIIGEPGIGKSRLVHELVQTLGPEAVTVLQGRCVSYGAHAPYHVALDVLRDACAIQDTDTSDVIEAKARTLLDRTGATGAAWAPYVLNLLCPGRDPVLAASAPERVRERTFEALQQLLIAQQERKPLVLVIEDLHWIDETSRELLAALADALVLRKILLVCTSRPGPPLPWAGRSHASQLALTPLSAEVSRSLVESALGGHAVTDELVEAILGRGEGNPFFLEELVRVLRGGDAMTRATIPETVEAVLSARILRLPDEDRQILQLAAVIGRDVPLALLEVVSQLPLERTRACVARLQSAEFLYPLRVGGDAAYTFSHALTWDVAHQLMLEDERRALHALVVAGIEDRYGSRLNDHVERLTEHAEQGELWERAIEYSRQAGHKAIAHSAYRDAVDYFTRALAALERAPATPLSLPLSIDLRLDLRTALIPLGNFGRVLELLSELQALTEQLGDARRQGLVTALMAGLYFTLGQSAEASRYGERAREMAAAAGDPNIEVLADTYLSGASFFLGEHARSIEYARRVVDLIPPERSHESFGVAIRPAVFARGFLSWSLSETGRFAEAEAVAREALEIAEAIGDPSTVALGLLAMGTFRVRRGEIEQSLSPFERANELCQRHDILFWRPVVASFLGYSLALLERFAEGEVLLRSALGQAAVMRMNVFYTQTTLWLGEARLLSGAIKEAEELAGKALEVTRERQEAGLEGWALRLVAEVSTYREPLDVAVTEGLYREAMQRAEACGLRPLTARCCLGLGLLYRRAGKTQEANANLRAAAALFSEMQMRLWSERTEVELRRSHIADPA